jgi:hypothetical protein
MKTLKFGFFGVLLTASMFVAGCKDACKDVTCVNGECVEGECICDVGYEGLDCSTALNAKFSGSFSMTETCTTSGSATYAVTVAPKSGTQDEVSFTGLWEEPQAIVTGHVEANGTSYHIEKQALGSSGFDIEAETGGSISADGTTITIAYTIYSGNTAVETCTGSLTK